MFIMAIYSGGTFALFLAGTSPSSDSWDICLKGHEAQQQVVVGKVVRISWWRSGAVVTLVVFFLCAGGLYWRLLAFPFHVQACWTFKGLILCLRSLLPHTSGCERWSQSFTEMRSIEVKDAMIISRGLMCEATMTKNTGLNSIISWVVGLNDRKSPFHSEYSCRSEHW